MSAAEAPPRSPADPSLGFWQQGLGCTAYSFVRVANENKVPGGRVTCCWPSRVGTVNGVERDTMLLSGEHGPAPL